MLWKCSNCGMTVEAESLPPSCPKCGSNNNVLIELSRDSANVIYESIGTNDILSKIIGLCAEIEKLSEEGIKANLDKSCFSTFNQTINDVWIVKERCKAEIASHMSEGKW